MDVIDIVDTPCGTSPFCGAKMQVPNGWTGACYGPNGQSGGQMTCGANSGANCSTGTAACNQSVRMDPLVVTGGACTPSQQTPDVQPVSWAKAGEACDGATPTGKVCNAGLQCLPKPKAPHEAGVCVRKDGDNTCPPGQFTQKHVFYTGATDTRDCTDCECGNPSGGSCTATVKMFKTPTVNSCTIAGDLVATINATSQAAACADIAGNPLVASRQATFSAVSGGTCAKSGGQPTGTAVPSGATTFCCIP